MTTASARRFGSYVLLDRVAHGGMAEVYRAKRFGAEGFTKYLAIKRILPRFNRESDFIEMFIQEAKVLVSVTHPNIVQVYDLGEVDGRYFIAMEFIAGRSLATLIGRLAEAGRSVPLPTALYLGKEVARGLAAAHEDRDASGRSLGLVHRDVSPQNVMLSWRGAVKIVDFGIARAATRLARTTRAGYLKGKFAYMSPEQAYGDEVDYRTDLFACGTMLWEMIADRRLFREETGAETLRNVQRCRPPGLDEVTEAPLPHGLAAVVSRALARDKDKRFQSGTELVRALTRILHAVEPAFSGEAELSRLMQEHFAAEIQHERDLLRLYEESVKDLRGLPTRTEDALPVSRSASASGSGPGAGRVHGETENVSAAVGRLNAGTVSIPDRTALEVPFVHDTDVDVSTPTAAGEVGTPTEAVRDPQAIRGGASRGGVRGWHLVLSAALLGIGIAVAAVVLLGTPDAGGRGAASGPERPASDRSEPGDDKDDAPRPRKASKSSAPAPATGTLPGARTASMTPSEGTAEAARTPGPVASPRGTSKAERKAAIAAARPAGSAPPDISPKPGKTATLHINSEPWARIYINGRHTGRNTPARNLVVPAGEVEVYLLNPPSGKSAVRRLTLRPGVTRTIVETLR